ncbi:hypothetical protein R2D22_00725 [Streptomyces sp. HUAS YS2]|uniref:Uncharacterized protein n=1 Tax=Streptomyces solicathayae TaxID=3081768 RepID=A0ABZ0LL41_9ACTN|nr:hypothetical protein [Streptomyces sp. HUAS YS2]WOX20000.1 hypothetical protein R2D22_00725 [Streptomyces sp. HUAS YS2]
MTRILHRGCVRQKHVDDLVVLVRSNLFSYQGLDPHAGEAKLADKRGKGVLVGRVD